MLSARDWPGRKPGYSYAASAAIIFLSPTAEPEILLAKQYPEDVPQVGGAFYQTRPSWKLITGEMEEEDETPLDTALREFREETGGEDPQKINFDFVPFAKILPSRRSAGFHQKWFFLGICAEKSSDKKDPHPEIEESKWFPLAGLPLLGESRLPWSHVEGLAQLLTKNADALVALGLEERLIASICAEITA